MKPTLIFLAVPGLSAAVSVHAHARDFRLAAERERLEARPRALIVEEGPCGIDPGNSLADLVVLKQLLIPNTK